MVEKNYEIFGERIDLRPIISEISPTRSFQKTNTDEEMNGMFIEAYNSGLKGISIYNSGEDRR